MRKIQWVLMFLLVGGMGYTAWPHGKEEGGAKSSDALEKLKEGNKRYVDQDQSHPDQSKARREEVAKGQHPFAIVLGCADSRVPPEVIFDQGLGDLFVNRVAVRA